MSNSNSTVDLTSKDAQTTDSKSLGGFAACSNRVQHKLKAMIQNKCFQKAEFSDIDWQKVTLRDKAAELYMEWQKNNQGLVKIECSKTMAELKAAGNQLDSEGLTLELRQKFEDGTIVDEAELPNLDLIPTTENCVVIKDKGNSHILAIRVSIPSELLAVLKESATLLPSVQAHSDMSSELIKAGSTGQQWLALNMPLFQFLANQLRFHDSEAYAHMSNIPGLDKLIADGGYHTGQKGQYEDKDIPLKRVAGLWTGLAINREQRLAGKPHKDSGGIKLGYNCAIPYGEWEGGDLLLWEIMKRMEVKEGYAIFFRGSILTHHIFNMTEGSVRNALDMLTHQNAVDTSKRLAKHGRTGSKKEMGGKRRKRD